jgi:hypothetical protein
LLATAPRDAPPHWGVRAPGVVVAVVPAQLLCCAAVAVAPARPSSRAQSGHAQRLLALALVPLCVGADAAVCVLSGAWYDFAAAPRRTSSGHAPPGGVAAPLGKTRSGLPVWVAGLCGSGAAKISAGLSQEITKNIWFRHHQPPSAPLGHNYSNPSRPLVHTQQA